MIGVCTKCRTMFQTTEEDACAPGTLCPACYRGRENHWTEREAQAAGDVAGKRCVHGVPVNVFCGKCESGG